LEFLGGRVQSRNDHEAAIKKSKRHVCTMAPTAENPGLLRCEIIFPVIFLFDRREQEPHGSCGLISQAFNPACAEDYVQRGSGAVQSEQPVPLR
jgi:hypothetical protein